MANVVAVFCEDSGHESFVRALLERLGREENVDVDVRVLCARGGRGKAIGEFTHWQRAFATGLRSGTPGLLVLVVDANCDGWREKRTSLQGQIDKTLFPRTVVGCPDPHVERWCLADAEGFGHVIGVKPPRDPDKCERDYYKRILREAILNAGHPILTSEMEFAPDLVRAFDLFRAGKTQASLGKFVEDLRAALRMLRG